MQAPARSMPRCPGGYDMFRNKHSLVLFLPPAIESLVADVG